MSETPPWYQALTARPAVEGRVVTPGPPGDEAPVVITNPAAYVEAALARECDELAAMAPDTGRNHQLNKAAFAVGRMIAAGLPLDEGEATERLLAACEVNGLLAEDGNRTCENSIRSGLKGGARHPLPWTDAPPAPMAVPWVPPAGLVAAQPVDPVEVEAQRQRVMRAARRLVDAEDAAHAYSRPLAVTLGDYLAQPDPPVVWTLEKLLQRGHNALITAAFKAGKTTLVNELARSIADGEPYLGKFAVGADLGRIALFNYEVDSSQYRRWLRDVGIANPDRVVVVNLRGLRAPLGVDSVMADIVAILKDNGVGVWVVDPFARAFTGGNENDNAEVGIFLDRLDIIKAEAGVHTLVMPVHTGRAAFDIGQERARGATRLDDWTDVRWLYNVDANNVRYFAATGRDVEVEEEAVRYDETARRLVMGGPDRRIAKRQNVETDVLAFLADNPGAGKRAIRAGVGGSVGADKAVDALLARHLIRCDKADRRGLADAYFSNATPFAGGVPSDRA